MAHAQTPLLESFWSDIQKVIASLSPYTHYPVRDVPVEAIRAKINAGLTSCSTITSSKEKYTCLKDLSDALLKEFSFKEMTTALEYAQFDCHDLMHQIAQGEYRITGNLADVYKDANFACFGAAYHGAVEGYFLTHELDHAASTQDLEKGVLSACPATLQESSPSLFAQCAHGTGHALMFVLANQLPQALKLCDTFAQEYERVNCYGGAFMENVPNAQLSPHEVLYIRADDPLYPCDFLDERYAKVCYTFQVAHVQGSVSKKGMFCASVPVTYQNDCYYNIGTGMPGIPGMSLSHPMSMVDACIALGGGRPAEQCIRGLVGSFVDRYATIPDKFFGMFDFCKTVPGRYTEACYMKTGEMMRDFLIGNTQENQNACYRAGDWRGACLAGLAHEVSP